MKSIALVRPALLALAATATLLGGCVVSGSVGIPAPRLYVGVVSEAPPPPQVEVIGVPPQPGYVWLGGYWNWVGGRHVWVGGHWEAPRAGYRWVPHEWVHAGGGWRLREGHWARR
ncbi:MAG: YXWGXW repeat-containing protein [Steroidobacteraceae bacterium]|jgi:hypothetical protein